MHTHENLLHVSIEEPVANDLVVEARIDRRTTGEAGVQLQTVRAVHVVEPGQVGAQTDIWVEALVRTEMPSDRQGRRQHPCGTDVCLGAQRAAVTGHFMTCAGGDRSFQTELDFQGTRS